MMLPALGAKLRSRAPKSYREFVHDRKAFVEARGLAWTIPLDSSGAPETGCDWDLRKLTDSHGRSASGLNGFAVVREVREAAVTAGWSASCLPEGGTLHPEVQDFIKALVVRRCEQKQSPRGTRHAARIARKFFSAISKMPWDLNTEDFNQFLSLGFKEQKVEVFVSGLARVFNENMLSRNCPIEPEFSAKMSNEFLSGLSESKHGEKLPDAASLYELTRIVFQEKPRTHPDLIRFGVVRILTLCGLRLAEVTMLPRDCLRWESHVDVVTGKAAGDLGGLSRTLRLHYFGLKQEEGSPDILVERDQWVPHRFQDLVASSIECVQRATDGLRAVLAEQHSFPALQPKSDLRRFTTSGGAELTTADLLFLVRYRGRGRLPEQVPADFRIGVVSENSVNAALGGTRKGADYSLFRRYGQSSETAKLAVEPHALRHLMNTEFFRLNVPDTVITHHFGRQTVAQSYEYDHRTLAEQLRFVQLPEAANTSIQPGTVQELVAKMVVGGFTAESHLERSFKRIQKEHGDEAAFRYLAANSDGFHVTPYGFCVNSFALNPCARHLKCFDDCRHYAPSGLKEHVVTLESLKMRLTAMRDAAKAKPPTTLGRKNQIAHAESLLEGVSAALLAKPGAQLFPNGKDHSSVESGVLR